MTARICAAAGLALLATGCASSGTKTCTHDCPPNGCCAHEPAPPAEPAATTATMTPTGDQGMQLGNFSVSLAVKDLAASRAFYEKLGFRVVGGNGKNFSIMQNADSTIGLFQGMFEKNILTYNPGWDRTCATLPTFTDVRDIQRMLRDQGITPVQAADESTTGPASLIIVDPDGNPILIDQHVAKPEN